MSGEKDKIYLTAEGMTIDFSGDHTGKYVTFSLNNVEIAIAVESFDSFTNAVMMTNDMWYGRGKGEE